MTIRLTGAVVEHYQDVDGYAAGHGMGPLEEMTLARFANFAWWLFVRNNNDQQRAKFRAKLWMPPKGENIDARSPWSAANESAAFSALKAGVGIAPATPKRPSERRDFAPTSQTPDGQKVVLLRRPGAAPGPAQA